MTKFNAKNNDKANLTFCRKNASIRGLYVIGFLILSLIALAPAVDEPVAAARVTGIQVVF
jgi:hypothetical protein